MISMHPEVEAKALAELDAHGLLVTPQRPTPRQLEWDDLGKLTHINNCIKACQQPARSYKALQKTQPYSRGACDDMQQAACGRWPCHSTGKAVRHGAGLQWGNDPAQMVRRSRCGCCRC